MVPGYYDHAPSMSRYGWIEVVNAARLCGVTLEGRLDCWGDRFWSWDGVVRAASLGTWDMCVMREDRELDCKNITTTFMTPEGKFQNLFSGMVFWCGIRLDGTLYCWGLSNWPEDRFTQASGGEWHACGLLEDGTVRCWGSGQIVGECSRGKYDCGQSAPPDGPFVQVAAGTHHSCGVRPDGSVECWGAGKTADACLVGDPVGVECGQSLPPQGTFVQVAAGSLHTCALDSEGHVTCWGGDMTIGDCGRAADQDSSWGRECGAARAPRPQ